MPSARVLERAVWIFLGLSGAFVVLGTVAPFGPIYVVCFGDVGRCFSVSLPYIGAVTSLLAAMAAFLGSFFVPRAQQRKTDAT